MFTGCGLELEASFPIESAQTNPVFRVDVTGTQRCVFGAIDFLEPTRLLGDDGSVVVEEIQDQVLEGGDIPSVGLVLEDTLVIDVG